MPEQTKNQPQQNKDANQNIGTPTSAADGLTQKELDQVVGGAQKFRMTAEGVKQG